MSGRGTLTAAALAVCLFAACTSAEPVLPTPSSATLEAELAARAAHTMSSLPDGSLRSGEVVVVGGTTDDRRLLASTEVYDPSTRTFRPGPPLQSERYKMGGAVVALPDGRIVVAGGGSGVEVLDLAAGSRRVDAAGSGRASFSTVGVTGSRVVLVGGYDERIRLTRTFASFEVSAL